MGIIMKNKIIVALLALGGLALPLSAMDNKKMDNKKVIRKYVLLEASQPASSTGQNTSEQKQTVNEESLFTDSFEETNINFSLFAHILENTKIKDSKKIEEESFSLFEKNLEEIKISNDPWDTFSFK